MSYVEYKKVPDWKKSKRWNQQPSKEAKLDGVYKVICAALFLMAVVSASIKK